MTARQADRIDLAALDRMHDGFVGRHPDWNDRIEAVCVGLATLGSFRTSRPKRAC